MDKIIKIAMLASSSAGYVLPEECLKPRVRRIALLQHPGPWLRSLCSALSSKDKIELEVFSHSRDINRIWSAEKEGVKYNFIPKYEPRRCDPLHFFLPARLQFLPLIKKFNPDVVHGFGTESAYGLLAVSQRKPSVVFIQGILDKYAPFADKPKLIMAIRKKLEKYVIHKVDGLIAETNFARRWAQSIRSDINVKVIPHGYTESCFSKRSDFRQRRIVCIGSLDRRKGCTTVLKSFYLGVKRNPEIFKHAELVFIGSGPLAEALKSRAVEYGISEYVCFKGQMPHVKITSEIEKACMLVIGSRVDTSPNVITEAHAVGIPVVGTNGGGIPEMIEEGRDGFVVPIDDAHTMSLRMGFLLKDMKRCAEMGRAGSEKVRKLNDPSSIADKHIAFYEEILLRSPGRIIKSG